MCRTRSRTVHRIQRIIDAREALWYLHCHQRTNGNIHHGQAATDLPDFGRGGAGDAHREGASGTEEGTRAWPIDERAPQGDQNLRHHTRVSSRKMILHNLRWMTTSVRAWIPQDLPHGKRCFEEWKMALYLMWVCLNSRAGVREEKWTSLDLRPLKFPSTTTSSVKRATLIQNFKADFIRAMGIISPSAALCAQAVIVGVQRDLPIYRRRDAETTWKEFEGLDEEDG